jgi:hypothetical protein
MAEVEMSSGDMNLNFVKAVGSVSGILELLSDKVLAQSLVSTIADIDMDALGGR